jgi:predicted double-glycine peptidase
MGVGFVHQTKNYDCGLAVFRNVLLLNGIDLSKDECKELVGTTYRGGTTKVGMVRGIKSMGLKPVIYRTRDDDLAWRWMKRHCESQSIVTLVDLDAHWVLSHGIVDGKVMVIDPTLGIKPDENGTYLYSKDDLLFRWKNKEFYAIKVSK